MLKNSLYNTIGGVFKLLLGLISVPFLTRNLGIEGYGLYATINAVTNIALFSEWSISASITVFLSKEIALAHVNDSTEKKYNTLSIAGIFIGVLAICTGILIACNSTWIASFFVNLNLKERAILESSIQLSSGIVSARLIHQYFIGVLQANKVYGIINIISTFYAITSMLCTLYIAALNANIIWIQICQIIVALLMIFVYYLYCRKLGVISIKYFNFPKIIYLKELSKYGLRIWISALGSTLFSQCDRLIVLRVFGAEISGMYAAITSLGNQINVISSMPVQPLLPLLSEYYGKNLHIVKSLIEPLIIKTFIVNACIIILSASGLIFFSTQITHIIFGKNTGDLSIIRTGLIITASVYSVYSFNAVGYFSLLAIKKEQFTTQIIVISGILSLTLIYILAIKFGIIGAFLGNIGYSLTLILNSKSIKIMRLKRLILIKEIVPVLTFIFPAIALSIYFNDIILNCLLYLILNIIILLVFKSHIYSILNVIISKLNPFTRIFKRF